MKSKATSFGIAALMVLMAFCCVSVTDEVDADEYNYTTLTGMHFNTDDYEKSRLFTVNEGEFYGYNYTLTIRVGKIDLNTPVPEYTILYEKIIKSDGESKSTGNTTIGKSNVSITENTSNKGSYDIIVSRTNTADDLDYTLQIKIDMKITVGSVVVNMDPILLRMSVTTSDSISINPTLADMEFEVGKYREIMVSESLTTPSVLGDINLYHWYAEGLPEGLSMSENGYVSGIAEAADTITAKVYIFGHEGNGEHTADLIINVNAATNNPDYFSYRIEGSVVDSTNAYDYVAVEGSKLKLILTPKDPSGSITFTVGCVNDNNEYSSSNVILNGDNVGECTLTTKGTGCYKVNIVYEKESPKEQETKFFHIYVIPAFDVVQAQMTIASS